MVIKLTVMVFLISISIISSAEENTSRHQSLWHALEPLGNEKQLQSEKIQQAFYEFGSFFQAMDAWRTSFYLPHREQPKWFAFREDIQEYTIKEFIPLNRLYKQNTKDLESCSIFFEGLWSSPQSHESANFDFSIIQPSANNSNGLNSKSRFGAVSGQLRLSEGSLNKDNTHIDLRATMAFDSMMFTEMLKVIETINMQFEQKHINRKNTEVRVTHAAQKTGHSINHLSMFEQQIFANLYSSLPHMMNTLTSFSTFEKLAKTVTAPSGQQVTMITHQQKINLEDFSNYFPDTYDDFNKLLTSISVHTDILTHDDKKIGLFSYDANTQQIFAKFVLANGGFMLQSSNNALLEEIIYPSQLNALKYKFVTHANVSMYGLNIDIKNIEVEGHYQAGLGQPRVNRTAKIDVQISTTPKIKVRGALLYFIPYWLIDLLIPGTLETLIVDAFVDVVTGNNGQGFTLGVEFKERDNKHQIEVNTAIEMPHKLLQAILKVEEPEESEQPRLYKTLRYNLREDFAATAAPYKDARIAGYLEQFLN